MKLSITFGGILGLVLGGLVTAALGGMTAPAAIAGAENPEIRTPIGVTDAATSSELRPPSARPLRPGSDRRGTNLAAQS